MEETVTPPICTGLDLCNRALLNQFFPPRYSTFLTAYLLLVCALNLYAMAPSRMMAGHAQLILQINIVSS